MVVTTRVEGQQRWAESAREPLYRCYIDVRHQRCLKVYVDHVSITAKTIGRNNFHCQRYWKTSEEKRQKDKSLHINQRIKQITFMFKVLISITYFEMQHIRQIERWIEEQNRNFVLKQEQPDVHDCIWG